MKTVEIDCGFEDTKDYSERLQNLLEQSGLTEDYFDVAATALDWYSAELPYHNIEHMFEVTVNVIALCNQHGIEGMARDALILAALWHDAAYPLPLEPHEESKEHRSALLAYEAILAKKDSEDVEQQRDVQMLADWTASLIISTHADRVPIDTYETILNQADTANVVGDSVTMLKRSAAFFIEGRMLAGEEFVGTIDQFLSSRLEDLTIWCNNTQGILTALTEKKLATTKLLEVVRENIPKITPNNILKAIRGKD